MLRALRGLGDLLCIVPALRALRAGLPDAHVTLLGLPWARAFVERFDHYLDDFLEFPGFPGIPERELRPEVLPAFFAKTQQHPFDLALQMHGSGTYSNVFLALLGARTMAGCCLPALHCPDLERFMPHPAHEPEVRRWVQLLDFLGLPTQGEALEFPIREADRHELAAVNEVATLAPRRYACLHPGAHEPERRWPVERFAAIGDALASRGLEVVITGSESEAPIARQVVEAMRARPLDLTGRTSLGGLAALLADARLVVCNDTGVSHLADAVGVPSVVVFQASDPQRWAPLDGDRHRAVGRPAPKDGCIHCRSCSPGHRCLREGCQNSAGAAPSPGVAPPQTDEVLAQITDLLNKETDPVDTPKGGAMRPWDHYAS